MVMDSVLCLQFGSVMKSVLSRWNILTRKNQFITSWPLSAPLLVEHSLLLEWSIQWFSQLTIWLKKHPKENSVNRKQIKIYHFQMCLLLRSKTGGDWLDSDLIPRLLENFENLKIVMASVIAWKSKKTPSIRSRLKIFNSEKWLYELECARTFIGKICRIFRIHGQKWRLIF